MLIRYLLRRSNRSVTLLRYPAALYSRSLFLMSENGENAAIPLPDIRGMTVDMHTPLKTPKRKAATVAKSQITSTADSGDDGAKASGSDLTPLHSEVEEDEKPAKKKRTPSGKPRKPRARKPSPVYEIPEVESKQTNFKGRLGYACLNTILRKSKPDPIFCSRTLRIATIKEKGIEYMKELGKQNMRDLATLIQWNEDHNIKFMRMSSEMFPFASHPDYGYDLEYAAEELKAAGDLAKKYGHRLTTHPGQFTQLGSPRKQVVDNAFRDLKYHCEMIDRMGLDQDSVMIIHGGGVFQDKPATLARLKENYVKLPDNVKGRLVLENDEICYNVDDLLPICEDLNIPLVFDYHHDWIYPSSQPVSALMPRILATWSKKGIKPKQHLSEPRPGAVTVMERRAHSDRCKTLPADLPDDMDLMLEAKDKEQAVFEMYRMYSLHPTIHKSLRPPAEVETLHTNGRKSNKKKKAKAEDDEDEGLENPEMDEDGNPITPAPKKRKRATPAKKKTEGGEGEEDIKPKRKTPAKKKAVKDEDEIDEEMEEIKPKRKTPAKKTPAKKTPAKKAVKAEPDEQDEEMDEVISPKKKRASPKKAKVEDSDNEPPHVEDAAAVLTGIHPLPEGFQSVSGEVHMPEAVVVEPKTEEA